MAEPAEHLVRLRRADSEAKSARVLAVLEVMVTAGEPPGSQFSHVGRVSVGGSSTTILSFAPRSLDGRQRAPIAKRAWWRRACA
jgi:hypothetical protein